MSIRRSAALRNALAQGFGIREVLRDGRLRVYSGSQPATADTAPTGLLLCEFTLAAGTYTGPTKSAAKITLTGTSGSVATVKVGGMAENLIAAAVPFNGTLNQTATDLATAINAVMNSLNITASAVGADVTLQCPFWFGANANGLTLAVTVSGGDIAAAINGGGSSVFGGTGAPAVGVTAVNGLNFLYPAVAGVLSKEAGTWAGVAANGGNAGWFRFVAGGSVGDGTATDIVFDGSIATSGGDITMGALAITAGAVQTVSAFSITLAA